MLTIEKVEVMMRPIPYDEDEIISFTTGIDALLKRKEISWFKNRSGFKRFLKYSQSLPCRLISEYQIGRTIDFVVIAFITGEKNEMTKLNLPEWKLEDYL